MDEQSIFLQAMEQPAGEVRNQWLDQACGGDAALRARIDALLARDAQAGSFLEKPPLEFEATIFPAAGHEDVSAIMDAGLSPAFGRDESVVIGNAGYSVLKSLGQTVDVPHIALRESQAEGPDPITRPKSPEIPKSNSDTRYRLDGEIARGGMGAIIKGRDTDLGRDLAIKVLLDSHKDKPEVIQRFVEEAQIGGQLQHPGIAPIYELGQFSDKRPFFAMKLVKGLTLSKLLADRQDAADERGKFIGIFEQVCQTMAYAHSRGVIHRDLKPANIMVGAFGEVQVMDWGLAKVLSSGGVADEKKAYNQQQGHSVIQTMRSGVGSDAPGTFGTLGSQTQMGSVMGTPAYMPPEQALGEIDNLDERADVFGLGAILCEILTGKPPYVGADGTQVYRMASRGKLDDAFSRLDACGADEDLIALTRHCLALEPVDRPRDAGVLAERVTGYLESVEAKLRDAEVQRAAEAARADAEAAQANAERQRAEAESERAEAESKRAHEENKRRRTSLALAASLLLMVGLGSGGWLYIERQEANRQTAEAAAQRLHATEMETLAEQRDVQRIAADQARTAAEQAEDRATAERIAAVEARQLAETAEEEGRKVLYETDMTLAPFVWMDENATVEQLRRRLDAHDPAENPKLRGKYDLRGFEWYYYNHLVQNSSRALRMPSNAVDCAVSPEGQLVTLDADGQIRRWDLETLKEVSAGVVNLKNKFGVLSPDGALVAFAQANKVHVYLTSTGAEAFYVDSEPASWRHQPLISFSPDGRLLIIREKDCVSLWSTDDGEVASTIALPTSQSPEFGFPRMTRDGQMLALPFVRSGLLTTLRRNGSTGELERIVWEKPLRNSPMHATDEKIELSPDGKLMASGNWLSGALAIWDFPTADVITRHDAAHPSQIRAVAFSPDSKQLATGAEDGTIKVWGNLRELNSSSRPVHTLKGHEGRINKILFHQGDSQVISLGSDKTVRIWSTEDASPGVTQLEGSGQYFQACFSPDGQLVAIADGHQRIQLWDAASGVLVREWPVEKSGVVSAAFSPDGRLIALGHDLQAGEGGVSLYDVDSGQQVAFLPVSGEHFRRITSRSGASGVAFSPDGKYLAACLSVFGVYENVNYPNPILVWDLSSRRQIRKLSGLQSKCVAVEFSRDGALLVGASQALSGTVVGVWSTGTWEPVQTLQVSNGLMNVESITLSPDGKTLATSVLTNSSAISLWDVATGSRIAKWTEQKGRAESICYSPDGRTIVAACTDGSVRLWSVATRRELMRLDLSGIWPKGIVPSPRHVRFSPDGKQLLVGFSDRALVCSTQPMVWNDPEQAAESLETIRTSDSDFPSRIRMLSVHGRLHEGLEQLLHKRPGDRLLQAALAATRADWHASYRRWDEAVNEFDRLEEFSPVDPSAWLRISGLIRVATALTQHNRPIDAAAMLSDGPGRWKEDGMDGQALWAQQTGTLRELVEQRLTATPQDAGLWELHAEIAGLNRDFRTQLTDYTAAIEQYSNRPEPESAADLARLYARRGNTNLSLENWQSAFDDYARAITDKTKDETLLANQALAEANSLLTKVSTGWTVLKPSEMKSEGGATLTLLQDGSILASGENPDQDTYTLVVRPELTRIRAIRLEALPDPSFKDGGSGRSVVSGNFNVNEIKVSSDAGSVTLTNAVASFQEPNPDGHEVRDAIDGKIDGSRGWSVYGRQAQPNWLIASLELDRLANDELKIELHCSTGTWLKENLGRFRLSVSNDPSAYANAEQRFAAMKIDDPWAKLAVAYHLIGDQSALDKLLEQHPPAAERIGDLYAMDESWHQAIELYSKLITDQTTDVTLLTKRAAAYIATEQWELARADWLRAIEQQPDLLLLQHALDVFWNGNDAGRREEALKLGEQVLTLRRKVDGPQHPETLRVMEYLAAYYNNFGFELEPQGKTDEAINAWRRALELNPDLKTNAPFYLGVLLERAGKTVEAFTAYLTAVRNGAMIPLARVKIRKILEDPKNRDACIQAVRSKPDLAQTAFDVFSFHHRWSEATVFGLLLLKQRPEDSLLWVQIAPIIALADDDVAYRNFCQGVVESHRKNPTGLAAERAIKSCLLRPGAIDVAELPGELLTQSLNDGTMSEEQLIWGWGSLAMLAYRSGDADAAVKHVTQSEQLKPADDHIHAINFALLALAQQQLKHPDEAIKALDEASQVIQRRQAIDKNHHDLLIAEILFREAEAKINGTDSPTQRKPAF